MFCHGLVRQTRRCNKGLFDVDHSVVQSSKSDVIFFVNSFGFLSLELACFFFKSLKERTEVSFVRWCRDGLFVFNHSHQPVVAEVPELFRDHVRWLDGLN